MRLSIIFFLCAVTSMLAQFDAFTYQGLLLDVQSNPRSNANVEFIVTISSDNAVQDIYLQEQHFVTTDADGVMTFSVGKGNTQSGSFDDIDWLASVPFITVEYDLGDNTGMQSLGTTQFSSVLFCLESKYVTCEDGPPGLEGPFGPQGPEGPIGASGATGQTGATGQQGKDGPSIMEQLSEPPLSPEEGHIYLDTGANRYDSKPGFRYYDGQNWIDIG